MDPCPECSGPRGQDLGTSQGPVTNHANWELGDLLFTPTMLLICCRTQESHLFSSSLSFPFHNGIRHTEPQEAVGALAFSQTPAPQAWTLG